MPQYTVQTNYGTRTVNADSPQQAQSIVSSGGQTVSQVFASAPAPSAGGSGVAAPAINLLTASPEQVQQITAATLTDPATTPVAAPAPAPTPTAVTDPLASIRNVFGPQWQPAPAFQNFVPQGIYGAVRVTDSTDPNKVYLLGPGGRPIGSPEEFRQLF